ncbi:hypothetical protein KCP78_02385 [Salmonella enterica subsp. enterica]|nr:hypothetical protein KCP78_02385 [Salmonella enterica subsp. enterica]
MRLKALLLSAIWKIRTCRGSVSRSGFNGAVTASGEGERQSSCTTTSQCKGRWRRAYLQYGRFEPVAGSGLYLMRCAYQALKDGTAHVRPDKTLRLHRMHRAAIIDFPY